jgi:hypothetical protein
MLMMRRFREEERRRSAQRLLAQVCADVLAEKPKPEAGEVSATAKNVLAVAAVEVGKPLTRLYQDLSLHPAEGKAALDELQARGLVRLHSLARTGRGGQPTTVEVLARADEELAKMGVTRPKPVLKGGFLHDVYGRRLAQWAKARGYQHWLERTLGKKCYDVLYKLEDGLLVAIEVCVSRTAHWHAEQALKALENEGVAEVVLACHTKKLAQEILRELKELDQLGLYRARARTCSLGVYME